jgi:hypothetical protein
MSHYGHQIEVTTTPGSLFSHHLKSGRDFLVLSIACSTTSNDFPSKIPYPLNSTTSVLLFPSALQQPHLVPLPGPLTHCVPQAGPQGTYCLTPHPLPGAWL